MPRFAIAVDVDKCTGCHACFLACKDEYAGNDYLPLTAAQPNSGHQWIRINEIEHGSGTKVKVDYIPVMCQHCEDAPCINAAPGAVYRRPDGIVIIDPEKAKGRKEIVDSCPYRVIYWNPEKNVAQKCTLCAHMVDTGEKQTRCTEACPTGAMVFGDLDDAGSRISQLLARRRGLVEDFKPEFGAKPLVKYIGLPKPFIAGEVLLSDRQSECVHGARVTLHVKGNSTIFETRTDCFGDFEFKALPRDTEYVVRAEYTGYLAKEITVRTNASKNLGEVLLDPK